MAFGSWEDVEDAYREFYIHSKYASHARAMLELIPRLGEHPAFGHIVPGTSHGTLFLEMPDKRTTVNVWGEQAGEYTVYLYHPTEGETHRTVVGEDEIITRLQEYVQRVQDTL